MSSVWSRTVQVLQIEVDTASVLQVQWRDSQVKQ